LPANVHIYSLGKEKGISRVKYILNFYKYICRLRRVCDAVFVHMNPEYAILGGLLWRFWNKPIALWYTHKSVNLKLRVATLLANIIFSASRESFRLRTNKLHATGHGIDIEMFAPRVTSAKDLHIITCGRISKTKRLMEMLDVLDVLYMRGIPFHFSIVGAPIFEYDRKYEKEVQRKIAQRPYANSVHFMGAVLYRDMPKILGSESVFINLSETGSIDRTVLEAMSIGLIPVTSNEAFREILEPYGLYVKWNEPSMIADALVHAKDVNSAELSRYVAEHHSLQHLIPLMLDVILTV